jgi:prephenate dehydrogenase
MDREMWSELFLENREFLLKQLYIYRDNINRYIKTIEDDDYDALSNLIQEGTCKKEKQLGKQ